jgi:hypothetical protein
MSYAHKTLAAALTAALGAGALVACGASGNQPASTAAATTAAATTAPATAAQTHGGVANPFVPCSDATEVGKLAGFSVTFPEGVSGYPQREFSAIEGQLAQAMYTDDAGKRVLVRKGAGTEDVSGDYNEYASSTTVDAANGATVTLKGDGQLVYVATWVQDGHAFAIDADAGLDQNTIVNLVLQTM